MLFTQNAPDCRIPAYLFFSPTGIQHMSHLLPEKEATYLAMNPWLSTALLAAMTEAHNHYSVLRHGAYRRASGFDPDGLMISSDDFYSRDYQDTFENYPVKMPNGMIVTDVMLRPDGEFPEYKIAFEFEYDGKHRSCFGFTEDARFTCFYD